MKTKCFILILLSCLFFSLYSCGKSGENISSSADESSSNEPLTYELGEYDIQKTEENVYNGKGTIIGHEYYLNVNIPVTNTSLTGIEAKFIIEYTIQDDTFTKKVETFPDILAPNETGTISLKTKSDRDEISFKSINEQSIKTRTKIILDIISQEVATEHHTGQNQSDCYDYKVTYLTIDCQNLVDYFKKYDKKNVVTIELLKLNNDGNETYYIPKYNEQDFGGYLTNFGTTSNNTFNVLNDKIVTIKVDFNIYTSCYILALF